MKLIMRNSKKIVSAQKCKKRNGCIKANIGEHTGFNGICNNNIFYHITGGTEIRCANPNCDGILYLDKVIN